MPQILDFFNFPLFQTKCLLSVFRDLGHQINLTKLGATAAGINSPHSRAVASRNQREDKVREKDGQRKVGTKEKLRHSTEAPGPCPVCIRQSSMEKPQT